MNKIVSLFIFISLSISAVSQIQKIDSLRISLKGKKNDSTRVELMLEIVSGYFNIKRDSALWYSQQALELSREINYRTGETEASSAIAEVFWRTGNYPEALRISLENLKINEELHNTENIFWAKRTLMYIYLAIGDSLKVLQTAKELDSMADSELLKDEKTGRQFKQILNNGLASIYEGKGKYDSAFKYEKLVYDYSIQDNDVEWLAIATSSLAEIYSATGNIDSEFYYYKNALIYAKKARRFDIARSAKGALASSFEKKGQPDSAMFYAYQYYNEMRAVPDTTGMMQAAFLLSKFYNQRKQYDSAYKYLSDFTSLKEKSLSAEKVERAQDINFNETLHQQQLQQERKQAQQQYEAKIKIYGLIGGLTIMLVLAFILYRNNKQKQKTNIVLQNQKEEIQNTLQELKSTQAQLIHAEKMASLGELTAGIAHEIQNPLNFVNNFSEVNGELIEELQGERSKVRSERDDALENEIINDIKQNLEKINHHGKRADAIVKGMLQHSKTSTGKKEPTDINKLADEYLRLSYHGMRAKDKNFNAEIKTDFDHSIEKINIIHQDIGRVLLNLINNAFYAVNEKNKQASKDLTGSSNLSDQQAYVPTVTVVTKKAGDKVKIKVADNGPGIPQNTVDKIFQPFFTTKPTGQGTGLGLSLAYDIIKAHGGEIKVETREGEGTEFIVQLPA